MKLFNLDLHISVIEDVKDILYRLFGNSIEITNWSISGHNWVMKKTSQNVKYINQITWKTISPKLIKEFQDEYDHILSTYDGFIVTHTPVFALLYEKYNKPIIMVNSCRYDQPFCWNINIELWNWLSQSLANLWLNGKLIAISNNKADQEYLRLGTAINSIHLPSLCLYTNANYNPTINEFVCYGERSVFPTSPLLVNRPKDGYTWKDLYSFRGIVHNPYEVSTMSLFEQYSAGVPLFLPSKQFYKKSILEGKMKLVSVYNRGIGYPPLDTTYTNINFWLDRADFYDNDNFKYIYYFDSVDDLIDQITNFNESEEIRQKRLQYIDSRRQSIMLAWNKLISDTFGKIKPVFNYF